MFSQAFVKNSVHGGVHHRADTPQADTPSSRQPLQRTVRILLEYSCYRSQRSWGKVMFLQASVILLTGGVPQTPLPEQTHPPPSRHTPPGSRHTPRADTPREQTPPPWEQTSRPACCEIRSTRGRYASYWNAILFLKDFWS